MNSLWNDREAGPFIKDPLSLRVYTSRLLGREASLVLHGGGNTSVKAFVTNIFGETEELLYIKGSGWDLASIESAGFAPVRLEVLKKMAMLDQLSDSAMVSLMRSAMTDPNAPTPSVEAILHAIIPFRFVDHTHADAVVTITNTPNGLERIKEIYGIRLVVIPYVMPGFILAKKVYELTKGLDWKKVDGMLLMHHGVFTFADDARTSYERMIELVSDAENYLLKKGAAQVSTGTQPEEAVPSEYLLDVAHLRQGVSRLRGESVLARLKSEKRYVDFSNHPQVSSIVCRGPLTPDHVIRTKRIPAVISDDIDIIISRYAEGYREYFDRHTDGQLTCLDPAPRWALWPGRGTVSLGNNLKETKIIADIVDHTITAIEAAEQLGGWQALPEKDIFDVEYWELEQAKLKKGAGSSMFQGKIALVTGAASGIGKACAEALAEQGAVVIALDIHPKVESLFKRKEIVGRRCDVTQFNDIQASVEAVVRLFGGLDIVVSNAGIFPVSETIEQMNPDNWDKSLDVNLTSHQRLMKACVPYLSLGIHPTLIIIGSKNVPAPGPGVSAYSVAKAGLTQLARVAALELGSKGIRVNVIHPNQVFDTEIWTDDILRKRASHYKMSVEEYKTNNILKEEITSRDVAGLVCALAGKTFYKTTGAQISIDGGNDRVI